MKKITDILKGYLNNQTFYQTCDLYTLSLKNGHRINFTSYDKDIVVNDVVYEHGVFLVNREQLKVVGEPSVDSLNVTIYCEQEDTINGIPFILACHNGTLDGAMLKLSRAYFNGNTCIAVLDLFEGRPEISSAGGFCVKLTVKAMIQGLAQQLPTRIFASQAAYTVVNGTVVTSSTDVTSMLIPLKPSSNVLVQV